MKTGQRALFRLPLRVPFFEAVRSFLQVPEIEAGESKKYVVYGQLTTEQEDQFVSVAIVSSIHAPKRIPLNDCTVRIEDFRGNIYIGRAVEDGKYLIRIPMEYLTTGASFRLEVITPAGSKLVSEYEELLGCPDIDSVFFIRERKPATIPENYFEGIQFYLNLDAKDDENTFYKFDIEESWEYHTEYPIE